MDPVVAASPLEYPSLKAKPVRLTSSDFVKGIDDVVDAGPKNTSPPTVMPENAPSSIDELILSGSSYKYAVFKLMLSMLFATSVDVSPPSKFPSPLASCHRYKSSLSEPLMIPELSTSRLANASNPLPASLPLI